MQLLDSVTREKEKSREHEREREKNASERTASERILKEENERLFRHVKELELIVEKVNCEVRSIGAQFRVQIYINLVFTNDKCPPAGKKTIGNTLFYHNSASLNIYMNLSRRQKQVISKTVAVGFISTKIVTHRTRARRLTRVTLASIRPTKAGVDVGSGHGSR